MSVKRPSREVIRAYTALHEGAPPRESRRVRVPRAPRTLIELGPLTDVVYAKDTPDGRHRYHHPFAADARPLLARDEHGRLHVVSGHYTVNERGIVDMKRQPQLPSLFGHARSRRRRSRRGGTATFLGSRANPTLSLGEFGTKLAVGGAAAVAFEFIAETALAYIPAVRTMTDAEKAAVQGGVGVGLALLGYRFMPAVALGVGLAGAADLGMALARLSGVRSYLDNLFRPRTTTTTTTTPSGAVMRAPAALLAPSAMPLTTQQRTGVRTG